MLRSDFLDPEVGCDRWWGLSSTRELLPTAGLLQTGINEPVADVAGGRVRMDLNEETFDAYALNRWKAGSL